MDNFLAIEPELIQRVREQLGAAMPELHVLCAADLAGVQEERQLVPAVHLVYRGYRVLEVNASRKAARVEVTCMAVVATRNARSVRSGADARADAGVLAARVIGALCGWQPPSAARPMALAPAPNASFSGGFQYLPLAFSTEMTVTASRP